MTDGRVAIQPSLLAGLTLRNTQIIITCRHPSYSEMMRYSKIVVATLLILGVAHSCTLGRENGCSTSAASGLTSQLVAELNSMGISFSTLSDTNRFRCTSPCQPFLQTSARNALHGATILKGDFITLNSAYRSSAQQYLLYRWYLQGICGIKLAARPGNSNHEGGLAIDTSFYNYWRSALEARSWDWFGSGDPVHFTYRGAGAVSGVSRESLRAFQRLWNRNNPSDRISEDGIYGPNTENRLSRAPCRGW